MYATQQASFAVMLPSSHLLHAGLPAGRQSQQGSHLEDLQEDVRG
jgi:hypothetical protein